MERLARKLGTFDYFALSFGTMIGVGWLVVMNDWLARGGPVGAALGFAIGTLLLVPIGFVYSRLVRMIPDEASEAAYTARAFGPSIAFATGWMMTLAYIIVCPWEALAIGKIAAYLFPSLDRIPLYTIAGQPVFLPRLLLGFALTIALTFINYRAIQVSARLQSVGTIAFLVLFMTFASFGAVQGNIRNLSPAFSHSPLVSVLLVLQIVPYFMTGFEAVPKCAEESRPGVDADSFTRAIYSALFVGGAFYVLVIAVIGFVAPWQQLQHTRFATAEAFKQVGATRFMIDLIFVSALISMVKVANGNFVAGSRILFGMARGGLIARGLARIHTQRQTPWIAVLGVGAFMGLTSLLGDHLLISVIEVGSLSSALGWFAASCALCKLTRSGFDRALAALAAVIALVLVGLKLLPWVPGHFTRGEYISLAAWIALGLLLRVSREAATSLPDAASSDLHVPTSRK